MHTNFIFYTGTRTQLHDGGRADGGREDLGLGTPPPGHRLGIRPRQTLQATQRGRQVRRTHLPGHPLPDPSHGRRQTNHRANEGS